MRFRTGLIAGLAVGYYYGARAGRERAVEIEAWLDKIRSTTTFHDARTKVTDSVREGTTAARHLLADTTFGSTHVTDAEIASLLTDPTLN
jgi:hypothetical protein